jgi:hypothetical protein
MPVRSVSLVLLQTSAVLLAACFRSASHSPLTRPIVTAVYDAVIGDVYSDGRPDTVLIGDSSLVFHLPTTDAVPHWRAQFDSFPPRLVTELARQSATQLPSSRLALPPSTRTITSAELQDIFSRGRDGWAEFYRRYPRQRLWITLSPVVFNQDSTQALLYREYHCGSLCGSGDLMWLERRVDATWRVHKYLNHWVS